MTPDDKGRYINYVKPWWEIYLGVTGWILAVICLPYFVCKYYYDEWRCKPQRPK